MISLIFGSRVTKAQMRIKIMIQARGRLKKVQAILKTTRITRKRSMKMRRKKKVLLTT